jgi:type II secretory pathway predicted ATPase ExeA
LELGPLGGGADVAAYLDIKFARLGKERKAVVSDEGCGALAEKLRRQTRNGVVYSIAYPLLINNWTRLSTGQSP